MNLASIAAQSMNPDYVSKITNALTSSKTAASSTEAAGTFDSIYDSALGLVNDTNTYIQSAQKAETDFALGNLTSTSELSAAQQKANLSLQYTVAIRDKVVEAYREIMNMAM